MTLIIATSSGTQTYPGLTRRQVNQKLQGWFVYLDRCPNVSIKFEVIDLDPSKLIPIGVGLKDRLISERINLRSGE